MALLAVLSLAACNKPMRGGDAVTCPIPIALPTSPTRDASDQTTATERCVEIAAYRLAHDPGTNEAIAEAALTACASVIAAADDAVPWDSPGMVHPPGEEQRKRDGWARVRRASLKRQALVHVAQARAGRCPFR